MSKPKKDLAGLKFGHLTVTDRFVSKRRSSYGTRISWECRCACGRYVYVSTTNLLSGGSTSCGCFKSRLSIPQLVVCTGGVATILSISGTPFKVDRETLWDMWGASLHSREDKATHYGRLYWGKKRCIDLHTFVLQLQGPGEVDHINRDGTDNRIINLRICTKSENRQNSSRTPRSGYRGVVPRGAKWIACINKDKEKYHLGSFNTPEEAAQAYDSAADCLYPSGGFRNRDLTTNSLFGKDTRG